MERDLTMQNFRVSDRKTSQKWNLKKLKFLIERSRSEKIISQVFGVIEIGNSYFHTFEPNNIWSI